jgi:putative transposase
MAQDEGCFGRLSIPRRAWAPPGIRPQAPRQVVREYTYVYAAVAPAEGKMTSLILPSADTEMMGLFLEHVSSTYANYFVVMQVDQASWHLSNELTIPENIRLIPQPAYSPELNPVEHVWEELREKQLCNLALPSLDAVIARVCEGLNQLEDDPERLRSLTYFPHFRMVS